MQDKMPEDPDSYLRKVSGKEILRAAIFMAGLLVLIVFMESGSETAKIIFGVMYAVAISYSGFKVSRMTSERWKKDKEDLSKSRPWKIFMWGMILVLLILFGAPLYDWLMY